MLSHFNNVSIVSACCHSDFLNTYPVSDPGKVQRLIILLALHISVLCLPITSSRNNFIQFPYREGLNFRPYRPEDADGWSPDEDRAVRSAREGTWLAGKQLDNKQSTPHEEKKILLSTSTIENDGTKVEFPEEFQLSGLQWNDGLKDNPFADSDNDDKSDSQRGEIGTAHLKNNENFKLTAHTGDETNKETNRISIKESLQVGISWPLIALMVFFLVLSVLINYIFCFVTRRCVLKKRQQHPPDKDLEPEDSSESSTSISTILSFSGKRKVDFCASSTAPASTVEYRPLCFCPKEKLKPISSETITFCSEDKYPHGALADSRGDFERKKQHSVISSDGKAPPSKSKTTSSSDEKTVIYRPFFKEKGGPKYLRTKRTSSLQQLQSSASTEMCSNSVNEKAKHYSLENFPETPNKSKGNSSVSTNRQSTTDSKSKLSYSGNSATDTSQLTDNPSTTPQSTEDRTLSRSSLSSNNLTANQDSITIMTDSPSDHCDSIPPKGIFSRCTGQGESETAFSNYTAPSTDKKHAPGLIKAVFTCIPAVPNKPFIKKEKCSSNLQAREQQESHKRSTRYPYSSVLERKCITNESEITSGDNSSSSVTTILRYSDSKMQTFNSGASDQSRGNLDDDKKSNVRLTTSKRKMRTSSSKIISKPSSSRDLLCYPRYSSGTTNLLTTSSRKISSSSEFRQTAQCALVDQTDIHRKLTYPHTPKAKREQLSEELETSSFNTVAFKGSEPLSDILPFSRDRAEDFQSSDIKVCSSFDSTTDDDASLMSKSASTIDQEKWK